MLNSAGSFFINIYKEGTVRQIDQVLLDHIADEKAVVQALEDGANPNLVVSTGSWHGWPVLAYAAREKYSNIVSLLLKKNANVDCKVTTNDEWNNSTPLMIAVYYEDVNTTIVLLEEKANPNQQFPNSWGRWKKWSLVKYLFAKIGQDSLKGEIHRGAEAAGREIIAYLLIRKGAKAGFGEKIMVRTDIVLRSIQWPFLACAVNFRSSLLVDILVEMKADVNQSINDESGNSVFVLDLAVKCGVPSIINKLIEKGAKTILPRTLNNPFYKALSLIHSTTPRPEAKSAAPSPVGAMIAMGVIGQGQQQNHPASPKLDTTETKEKKSPMPAKKEFSLFLKEYFKSHADVGAQQLKVLDLEF